MRTMDPSAAPLGNTSDSSTGDDVSNTVTPAAVPEALAPDVMSDETPATAASGMASASVDVGHGSTRRDVSDGGSTAATVVPGAAALEVMSATVVPLTADR